MSSVNGGLICVHAILYCTMNKLLSFAKGRVSEPRSTHKHQQKSDPLKGLIISALLYECQAIYHNSILLYDSLSMRLVDYFEFMASDKLLTPRKQ